jgi:hypothetical protein
MEALLGESSAGRCLIAMTLLMSALMDYRIIP